MHGLTLHYCNERRAFGAGFGARWDFDLAGTEPRMAAAMRVNSRNNLIGVHSVTSCGNSAATAASGGGGRFALAMEPRLFVTTASDVNQSRKESKNRG